MLTSALTKTPAPTPGVKLTALIGIMTGMLGAPAVALSNATLVADSTVSSPPASDTALIQPY